VIISTGTGNTTEKGDKFEKIMAEEYKRRGYYVKFTPRKDHGIDLIISKNGYFSAVQCKNTKKRVQRDVFRKLESAMYHNDHKDKYGRHYRFKKGIVVSTGGFTEDAITWVYEKNHRHGYRKFNFYYHKPIDEDISGVGEEEYPVEETPKKTALKDSIAMSICLLIAIALWFLSKHM
jgi:hypothetical protein